MLPPAFGGEEIRHVDRFLDVAARLVEDLAHLTRHVSRELFLALGKDPRRLEQDLRALWRGHQAPGFKRPMRRVDRLLCILDRGVREGPDEVVGIRGITIFEGF